LKLEINNKLSKIILKESTHEEYNQLKNNLTPYVKGYRFMPRFKLTSWDGKYDYFNNGVIDFGLWHEVYKTCKENNYSFNIINREEFPRDNDITIEKVQKFVKEFYKGYKLKNGKDFIPYEHQVEAVYKMLKNKFCSIEVATSGGKSLIFATMIFYILKNVNPNAKILLIVPNISLVNQFYDDILDYNEGFNKENKNPLVLNIQEIMSDRPRKKRDDIDPNIYIGTFQSLINWGTPDLEPDFFKQFNLVSVDECLHPKTKITMSDNTKKDICDVKKGDFVWVFNEKTKQKEIKEVDYVYKNLSKEQEMYEIEMDNGEVIWITGNHKVLLIDNTWKRVDELTEKNEILDFYINT